MLVFLQLRKKNEIAKEELQLKQDQFYYDVVYEEKSSLLDSIIKDECNYYYIKKIGGDDKNKLYISDEQQKIMIAEVTKNIIKTRMTNMVLSNLSLYYNINDYEDLVNVVSMKVSLIVLDMAISINSK